MTTEVQDKEPKRTSRTGRRIDGARKYWWAGAIAVPIVVALIQTFPAFFGGSASGNTYITNSRIGGDLYFTTNVQLTEPAARAQFDRAVALAQQGNYAEAKGLFEQLAVAAKSAEVYNNLGVVNAALGDDAAAQRSVQQALQIEPGNQGARANLELLSKAIQHQGSNDTILTAAPIPVGANVQSSIAEGNSSDFFTFATAPGPRDILQVRVDNQSTTLKPHLKLFNAERSEFGSHYEMTAGANVALEFAAAPGSKYFAQVVGFAGSSGAYTLSVAARKAFDRFEPNDDILKSSDIRVKQDVEANIMDVGDDDVYRFAVGAGPVRALLTNRSATLAPEITLFDDNRSQVANQYTTTPGAHISAEAVAARAGTWYLRVKAFTGASGGEYTIKVDQ